MAMASLFNGSLIASLLDNDVLMENMGVENQEGFWAALWEGAKESDLVTVVWPYASSPIQPRFVDSFFASYFLYFAILAIIIWWFVPSGILHFIAPRIALYATQATNYALYLFSLNSLVLFGRLYFPALLSWFFAVPRVNSAKTLIYSKDFLDGYIMRFFFLLCAVTVVRYLSSRSSTLVWRPCYSLLTWYFVAKYENAGDCTQYIYIYIHIIEIER